MHRVNVWSLAATILILFYIGLQLWQLVRSSDVKFDYDEGVFSETAFAATTGGHLYRDIFLSQPPLLISVLKELMYVWGPSITVARGSLVAASVLWLASLYLTGVAVGRPRAGVLVVCVLLGSRLFLTHAHWVDMEVPSESLAAAAVAFAVTGTQRPGVVWWVAAGLIGALGVMTKLSAAACVVPLITAVLIGPPASRWRRLGALAIGGALGIVPWLPQIGTKAFLSQVIIYHLELAHHWVMTPGERIHLIAQFLVGEWPLVVAAVAGGGLALIARDQLRVLLLMWFAAECAIVLTLTPLFGDHFVILLSPLVLLAGLGLDRLVGRVVNVNAASEYPAKGVSHAVKVGIAVVGSVGLLIYLVSGAWMMGRATSSADPGQAADRIACLLPPGAEVLTDDPLVVFLAHRRVPWKFIDSSIARFRAGELTEAELVTAMRDDRIQAVLFWRGTFRDQFPGLIALAAQTYPVRQELGGDRFLLLRRNSAQSGGCIGKGGDSP